MDLDKYKKWMEAAQQFQSDTFWNNIFDSPNVKNPPLAPLKMSDIIPKCDLYESGDVLIAEIELPGAAKESLHISVQTQLLTVNGEFKSLQLNHKYHLKERPNHQFKKQLTLPYPIDAQNVKSELRNGILTVVMPIRLDDAETIPIQFDNSTTE
ncbi:Hsp20/alpha crystallin family protein [Neobacillus sp. Marseille-QA0830]